MAIRTTATAVQGIIDVTTGQDLTAFIETASSLVDEVCDVQDDDGNDIYSAARLELIERWLSAHYYAILAPRADMEKAGPVSEKVQYKVDLNLAVTTYGQQAMVLDTNGGLAELNAQAMDGKKRSVSMFWAGTERD